MKLLTAQLVPHSYQLEDLKRLQVHPRVNVWLGLGLGKTAWTLWWLQLWWRRGLIDGVLVVAPGMVIPGWGSALEQVWPKGLGEFIDARPSSRDRDWLEALLQGHRVPWKFTLVGTTYAAVRQVMGLTKVRRRWV